MGTPHRAFEFFYLISEIIVIVLYLLCTEYSTATQGKDFFKDTTAESVEELWTSYVDKWNNIVPADCTEKSKYDEIKICMQNGFTSFAEGDTRREVLDKFKMTNYAKCLNGNDEDSPLHKFIDYHGSNEACNVFIANSITQL